MHCPKGRRGFWNKEGEKNHTLEVYGTLVKTPAEETWEWSALLSCHHASCSMLHPLAQGKVTIIRVTIMCPSSGNLLNQSIKMHSNTIHSLKHKSVKV